MGVILMRPLTSGVFQRLMAEAFPEIDVLDVGRLLLNYVLSDPYVDVALVGMREPRFVELNCAYPDHRPGPGRTSGRGERLDDLVRTVLTLLVSLVSPANVVQFSSEQGIPAYRRS